MNQRARMLLGGILGVVWAIGVVWVGVTQVELPVFTLLPTLASAFLGPGLVLALLVMVLSWRRFLSGELADGAPPPPGSGAAVDSRVLQNTLEQIALALCLWPPTAYLATSDGPGLAATLGLAFVPARLAFWIGYRISPPLRLFGFAATFYATLLALLWSVIAAYGFAAGLAAG